MANPVQFQFELWSSLGGTDFSGRAHGSQQDRLWNFLEQSRIPLGWNSAQPEEGISAENRVCLGRIQESQISFARQLGNLQRSPEHAFAGRFHHYERRATKYDFHAKLVRRWAGLAQCIPRDYGSRFVHLGSSGESVSVFRRREDVQQELRKSKNLYDQRRLGTGIRGGVGRLHWSVGQQGGPHSTLPSN